MKKKHFLKHHKFWNERQTIPPVFYDNLDGITSYMFLPDWRGFPRKKLTPLKQIANKLNPPSVPF